MNEAVMKKEEEEKKKKEEERRMRTGAPFGQPRQVEPAGKNPPAPFAPAAKEPGQARKPAAPFAGEAKQGDEQKQRIFQGSRNSPFGDDLMLESQGVEQRARVDYERAVAREKKALVEKAGRTVVVKHEGREEKGKAKEGKKKDWNEKEKPPGK